MALRPRSSGSSKHLALHANRKPNGCQACQLAHLLHCLASSSRSTLVLENIWACSRLPILALHAHREHSGCQACPLAHLMHLRASSSGSTLALKIIWPCRRLPILRQQGPQQLPSLPLGSSHALSGQQQPQQIGPENHLALQPIACPGSACQQGAQQLSSLPLDSLHAPMSWQQWQHIGSGNHLALQPIARPMLTGPDSSGQHQQQQHVRQAAAMQGHVNLTGPPWQQQQQQHGLQSGVAQRPGLAPGLKILHPIPTPTRPDEQKSFLGCMQLEFMRPIERTLWQLWEAHAGISKVQLTRIIEPGLATSFLKAVEKHYNDVPSDNQAHFKESLIAYSRLTLRMRALRRVSQTQSLSLSPRL